ncbi:hypothetical protein BIY22_09870 [Vibrio panuliri]|uniref:Nudix hydrolase domain-containing protein n=2 Tax=Vibrio panuliri TaxID=1381081 RepID=A0A1Q9HFE4_9VIBR|nr:hypothetical protein BIY22_09870 [Vibrio panuliri]
MKTLLRSYIVKALGFLLIFISLSSMANTAPKGAVCLIRSDNNLVMVKEILTGKWSLPAGTIEANEPPQLAAQREVWEETGLVVTVGKELGRSDRAVFYDCVSDSDLIAFSQQDSAGGYALPIWFAPHYGIEVAQARLVDPNVIEAEAYRYPLQWQRVKELYQHATSQPTNFVESLAESAPSLNQLELPWIAQFQAWLLYSDEWYADTAHSLIMFGLLFSSPWWLLLLPVCYAYFGRDFTLKLVFTIIFGAMVVQLGKDGFQLPRPFAYQPSLNLAAQTGFGLPSLSLTLWTIAFAMIGNQFGERVGVRFNLLSVVVSLWLVIALFYSGSTFLVDSLAGMLFGWLCAWHMSRLETKLGSNSVEWFSSKGVWLVLSILSTTLTALWQSPMMLGLSLTSIALLLSVVLFKLPTQVSMRRAIALSIILVVVSIGFILLHGYVDTSNLKSLIVKVAQLPSLVLISCGYLICSNKKT